MSTYFTRTEHATKQNDLHDPGELATKLTDDLSDYSPSIGFSDRGWLSIRLAVAAPNADAAARTAALLTRDAARRHGLVDGLDEILVLEVYAEPEFDAREGFADTTEWMTVAEVMDYLDITRQAALQQIADGKFPGAEKQGDTYRIPAASVHQRGIARIYLGWDGVEIRDEDIRPVLDPMYERLRASGPLRAYAEWLKSEAGEPHSVTDAHSWHEAVQMGRKALRARGYDASSVTFSAHAMRTRGEVRYPGDD